MRRLIAAMTVTAALAACGDVERVEVRSERQQLAVRDGQRVLSDRDADQRVARMTTTTMSPVRVLQSVDAATQRAAVYASGLRKEVAGAGTGERVRAERMPGVVHEPPVPAATSDCDALLVAYFADVLAWARSVAHRESRCTNAFNPEGCDTSGRTESHAYGPLQICAPLHEQDFAAVGCAGNYRDMRCAVAASRHLYDRAGRGPWGG